MGDHLETLLEQTAGLHAPLPGESPAGADLSFEPELEEVKTELEKLTSLEGGDVDWRLVVERTEELLATRTKDLRLAVWLTAGGIERSGWRGFARGLVVCRALVTELWDALLPKREKARSNIVAWLGERVAPRLEGLSVTADDADDVRACAELAVELDRALADKLGDAFPGIRGLISATRARVRDIPEPPPPEPTPELATEASSEWAEDDDDEPAAAAPPASPHGAALSARAEDADATARTCGEALVALARSIVVVDPTRAWAYRLHRVGIWLAFERVPVDGGALRVPGPDAGTVAALRELFASSRWHELVVAGEEATARYPLWLDPHRLVGIALERMGPPFNDAREAVGRAVSDFARRSALLLEGRFEGEIPAASRETCEWLEAEAKRWQLGSRAVDVARDEDRALAARFDEARDLITAGRSAEGLAIAVELARRGASARARFRSSLDVARLATDAGAPEVARPILEDLVTIAATHALEAWEPSLCAQLYARLYQCLPVDAPERARAFEVLCRLDPGAALRARGDGEGTNHHALRAHMSPADAPLAPGPSANAGASSSLPPRAAAADANGESEWADDD